MLPATTRLAPALDYPTRPVHLIEGFGAGGAPDIIARLIGQALSKRLGQSFVIDNKGDSLTDNLWAEMNLMMVLVVIVLALAWRYVW